jgi:predicted ArsR family transcriptional regulator
VREAATLAGRSAGAETDADGSETDRATEALARHGYEPRMDDGQVVLANCPFHALVKDHTALVCSLNEAFVSGVLDGLGCTGLEACLDPEPGMCCVKARARP